MYRGGGMSKFTKGPWRFYSIQGANGYGIESDADHVVDGIPIMKEADARLISKAPEMLEMLIKIHDALEHRKGTVSNFEIRLLIMKARDGGFKDE